MKITLLRAGLILAVLATTAFGAPQFSLLRSVQNEHGVNLMSRFMTR
jgi:hypothetical protein